MKTITEWTALWGKRGQLWLLPEEYQQTPWLPGFLWGFPSPKLSKLKRAIPRDHRATIGYLVDMSERFDPHRRARLFAQYVAEREVKGDSPKAIAKRDQAAITAIQAARKHSPADVIPCMHITWTRPHSCRGEMLLLAATRKVIP